MNPKPTKKIKYPKQTNGEPPDNRQSFNKNAQNIRKAMEITANHN